ncbi:MAG: hypothetical protein IIB90_07670 [Gemmatimonadetes bacterium]|nr:hypothetical protein [Gemmatimonadota bacterium]
MAQDLVPPDKRISREALERIIHRAAELHTKAHDVGDQLTPDEVLELGKEVGIPTRHLQQALLEERARGVTAGDQGMLVKLAGPKRLSAARTVPGQAAEVETTLSHWMTAEELLTIKRRYPQGRSWEARKDVLAALKRSLGVGGRRYALARAKEILGRVEQLEDQWCHVTLIADLSNTRTERVAGGAAFLTSGAALTAIAVVLGVAAAVAVLPAVAGVAGGLAIARSHRSQVERVQVAMEQVLDGLEREEITVPTDLPDGQTGGLVKRLTAEIREIGKNLSK